MLIAQDVAFDEHHFRLIEPTDFSAPEGQLSLLQASTALSRTSLALIASGRMKPDVGEVWYQDDAADPDQQVISPLRRRAALVDSPGITAPEHHMTVRQTVAESLALRPVYTGLPGEPGRRRTRRSPMRSRQWLQRHSVDHLATQKVAALDAGTRLRLLIELAFADPAVRCAVIDSPDRHRIDPYDLLQLLETLTDTDQPRAVLAVVAHIPEGAQAWAGGAISFAEEAGSAAAAAAEPASEPGEGPESEEPDDDSPGPKERKNPDAPADADDEPEESRDASPGEDLTALESMMEDER